MRSLKNKNCLNNTIKRRITTSFKNRLKIYTDPNKIHEDCEKLIKEAKDVYNHITNLPPEKHTFAHTVLPLGVYEGDFITKSRILAFPSYVSPHKEIRDASLEATKRLSEWALECLLRKDMYDILQNVEKNEGDKLSPSRYRILSRMLQDHRRSGLNLSEKEQQKVKELKKQLTDICIQFSQNIAEDNTYLEFSEDELEGLNSDYTFQKKGDKYVVTMQYPDYFPIMQFVRREETRRKMQFAYASRCPRNVFLFEEAIKLRTEIAKLLGYPTHAHYVLETRMAKSPDRVMKFLNTLKSKLIPKGKEELKLLLNLKKEHTAKYGEPFDGKINQWDYLYYVNLLKGQMYNIDYNEIKKYFPLEKVLHGLFEIFQHLLNVRYVPLVISNYRFVEILNPIVWHEDVRHFNVFDAETGDLLGQFYLDIFPREGKFSNAAAKALQCGFFKPDGSRQYPAGCMIANLTKPSSNCPSLLRISEIITLFHEFGHLAHRFCTKSKWARFEGTAVERDFVETPSTLMENWVWEKEVLKKISGHYKTGEPLPDEVIDKLIEARNVGSALETLRQVFLSLFDMISHTTTTPFESVKLYNTLQEEIALIPATAGTHQVSIFGHIMRSYDAQYYSYLHARVYSDDMFSVFKEKGIMNQELGLHLRKTVLEVGGMKDGIEIARDFLGRNVSMKPFLSKRGIE